MLKSIVMICIIYIIKLYHISLQTHMNNMEIIYRVFEENYKSLYSSKIF